MKPEPEEDDAILKMEEALADMGQGHYVLRLYLTGSTRRSVRAVEAIKALCEQYLKGRYDLEVIDLYQQPDRAKTGHILAAPTLVKELPPPLRRLVGDLTDPDRVLLALNLKPEVVP